MRLSVNGKTTDWEMDGYKDLSTAVADMRQKFMDSKQVVVDAFVDGQEVEITPETWERPLKEFEELSITVESAYSLCRNVVSGLQESLSNLPAVKVVFQELLIPEKRKEAMSVVHELVELCHSLLESIINVAALTGTEPDEVSVNGQSFDEASGNISVLLQDLNEALKAENYLETADLLEHELLPMLESWNGTLDDLSKKVDVLENAEA
ncbi:MAG: hypothetical protein V3V10_10800 [Planctomycetota bacterium]